MPTCLPVYVFHFLLKIQDIFLLLSVFCRSTLARLRKVKFVQTYKITYFLR